MHASARGWREQDRAAKRLILMLKTLLMVMFKTSKLRLTEKKHLHTDEVEQMSSLESVKVRRRSPNAACLTAAFLRLSELLQKLRLTDDVQRLRYGPDGRHLSISALSQLQRLLRLNCPCRSFNTRLDMRLKRTGRASERGVHNDRMRTHLHGLLAVALGKRIKLLTLPYIHLPPTITPIEPESLGEAALIFTAHLHPPATTIPTGNIISLHILCIQHNGVGECAEMCGCGRAQISLLCIYGGDKLVVKRILKGV